MAFSKGFSPSLSTHLAQSIVANDRASIIGVVQKIELCERECFLFAGVGRCRSGNSSAGKGVTISYSK